MSNPPEESALYVAGRPTSAGSGVFRSTPLTGGPWRADAQHGGPPAALLARMIEGVLESNERVARISVELLRPVPLEVLTATADRQSNSRRVAHATARLQAGGEVVAKASALLLSTADLPTPDWQPPDSAADPATGKPVEAASWLSDGERAFHRDALEHRIVTGGFSTPGPAVEWIRLRYPVVLGERPSPLCRIAAAADVASGISAVYSIDAGVGLINADLSIAVHRPLEGEWVGIDATTHVGPDGIGLCVNRLFDTHGTVGSATQSLIGWQTR